MKISKMLADSINKLQHNEHAINKIRKLFPETWTHVENLEIMKIAFYLKINGVDFRSNDDFGSFMVIARNVGLIEMQGMYLVRRGTSKVNEVPLKYLKA